MDIKYELAYTITGTLKNPLKPDRDIQVRIPYRIETFVIENDVLISPEYIDNFTYAYGEGNIITKNTEHYDLIPLIFGDIILSEVDIDRTMKLRDGILGGEMTVLNSVARRYPEVDLILGSYTGTLVINGMYRVVE